MRHAGNFNPEWGYLAPAPSFLRTARIVVVAAVIGATAGAAVVFSLTDRPAAEESVAARTLAQPVVSASAPVSMPAAAQRRAEDLQVSPQPQAEAQNAARGQSAKLHAANDRAPTLAASESSTTSTTQHPASVAALAEAPAVADVPPTQAAVEAVPVPDGTLAQKKVVKKPRYAWRSAPRGEQSARGPLALLRPFGARTQNGDYLQRGEY
jgi:hypothetical protein